MEPAGLMWSVVTLSPRFRRTAAFSMSLTAGGSLVWAQAGWTGEKERESVKPLNKGHLAGDIKVSFI